MCGSLSEKQSTKILATVSVWPHIVRCRAPYRRGKGDDGEISRRRDWGRGSSVTTEREGE